MWWSAHPVFNTFCFSFCSEFDQKKIHQYTLYNDNVQHLSSEVIIKCKRIEFRWLKAQIPGKFFFCTMHRKLGFISISVDEFNFFLFSLFGLVWFSGMYLMCELLTFVCVFVFSPFVHLIIRVCFFISIFVFFLSVWFRLTSWQLLQNALKICTCLFQFLWSTL